MTENVFSDDAVEWHDPLPYNVPRQTYTPAILSLGLVLLLWGILAAWVLVAAGLLLVVVGVGGWTRELIWQSTHYHEEATSVEHY